MNDDFYDFPEYRVRRAPDVQFTMKAEAAGRYIAAVQKGEPIDVSIGGYTGKAYVIRFEYRVAPDGYNAKITLKPTGRPVGFMERALAEAATRVSARLERELLIAGPVGITSTKEKTTVKKLKKFYIGKPEVVEGRDTSAWGKDTLPEAIEHAKQRARETGQPQYIVKVIKVVSRQDPPVSVKDVK